MIITFHGEGCVRLQVGDTAFVCNAPREKGKRSAKYTGQAILTSVRNDSIDDASNGSDPFPVYGPGEYEVNGIFIQGFPSQTTYGGDIQINTIYSFVLDDMKVVHLGMISHTDLDSSFVEHADDIDILFVPISGKGTLDASQAYELAVKLQPRLIIPVLHEGTKDPNLIQFLKEAGITSDEEEKITIKRKDIAELENSIRVLANVS